MTAPIKHRDWTCPLCFETFKLRGAHGHLGKHKERGGHQIEAATDRAAMVKRGLDEAILPDTLIHRGRIPQPETKETELEDLKPATNDTDGAAEDTARRHAVLDDLGAGIDEPEKGGKARDGAGFRVCIGRDGPGRRRRRTK